MAMAATLLAAAPAAAWSPTVHQKVTTEAIDTLPKPLKAFYKDHRLEIPSLGLEATLEEDGPDRRFTADRVTPFPFTDLPRNEAAFKARHAEEAARVGRLPWLIQEGYAGLVEAFRSGDKAKVLAASDTLAGYVADLDNPLATTDNFDGQKTGQHGLWVRFSARFPESMGDRLDLAPEAARYLDDPNGYAFSMLNGSYVWADNVLYEEDLARRGQSGYSERYYQAFEHRAAALLKARLSQAAADVGSYWFTAWTAAGRPELK
ncbi:MAG TPA: hypothetical protein VFM29_09685 [Vicinamibacteria bacterium]|nr:hypothetical protein [Vicinamibacteria bacterium]